MYTWSNSIHIPMYYETILHYFPVTIESSSYFNSAYRVYKKGKRKLKEQKNILNSLSKNIISIYHYQKDELTLMKVEHDNLN